MTATVNRAAFSEGRLAWMLAKMGGVSISWTKGGETWSVSAEAAGALHRGQPERKQAQPTMYEPQGTVRRPQWRLVVMASAMEGKALPEKGDRIMAGGVEFRCTDFWLAPDETHFILELNEEAE